MEKKNTMLLTVIAVATLLVAVVGATFAYFSLTVGGSASTTTAAVTAGKVPTITLDSENKNLYLKVSATDMSQANATSKYYAKETSCGEEESCNTKAESEDGQYKKIFKLTIAGSDTNTTYTCTGKLKVTATGTMLEKINENTGDVTIGIKGYNTAGEEQTLDLQTLKNSSDEEEENTKKYDIEYEITGNGEKSIEAYVVMENRSADQNYLAGESLNITLSTETVKCEIKNAGV